MKTRLFALLAIVSSVLFAFQNCAQSPGSTGRNGVQSTEVIVASTSDVSKVTFDTAMEYRVASTTAPILHVDLQAGSISLTKNSSTKNCSIDSTRLASLDALLSAGKVCKPAPLADGLSVCMAIGLADIKLEGSSDIYLRPLICSNGQFLCEGQDQAFRDILEDLVANPPADCN